MHEHITVKPASDASSKIAEIMQWIECHADAKTLGELSASIEVGMARISPRSRDDIPVFIIPPSDIKALNESMATIDRILWDTI